MFKSSENLRLAAEMRALTRVASPWREARSTWFDGTPESIEARLAATDKVLVHAQSGFTTAHLDLTNEALKARRELIEARHCLLTDFLDDGARAFKGSKRVAGAHDQNPEEPWRNTINDDPYRDMLPTPDFDQIPLGGEYEGQHRSEESPLGPGYDRPGFGHDDIDDYENHLHDHDYHVDNEVSRLEDEGMDRSRDWGHLGSHLAAAEDEGCDDCGADAGEKCRPWCTGKAKHDDEKKSKKKSKKTSSVSDFDDELMYFDLS